MHKIIKERTKNKQKLMLVKVPDNDHIYTIDSDRKLIIGVGNKFEYPIENPDAWSIVNTASSLTKKQAKKLIERSESGIYFNCNWEKPQPVQVGLLLAIDAFFSLMTVNECYTINPYIPPRVLFEDGSNFDEFQKWQKAEESTGEWLILIAEK